MAENTYTFSDARIGRQVAEPAQNRDVWAERYRATSIQHPSTVDSLLQYLDDPRNAWVGFGPMAGMLGPLFKSGRGWEVLQKYVEKGGTPESLRKILRERGYNEGTTGDVGKSVRQGTDLAAPPSQSAGSVHMGGEGSTMSSQFMRSRYPAPTEGRLEPTDMQRDALSGAANRLLGEERHLISPGEPHPFLSTAGEASRSIEGLVEQGREFAGETVPKAIPSGTAGQGAYNAISSRMAKMMDDPAFKLVAKHFDLPPVSDREYYKEFPIEGAENNPLNYNQRAPARGERHSGTPAARVRADLERDLGIPLRDLEEQDVWQDMVHRLGREPTNQEYVGELLERERHPSQRYVGPTTGSLADAAIRERVELPELYAIRDALQDRLGHEPTNDEWVRAVRESIDREEREGR